MTGIRCWVLGAGLMATFFLSLAPSPQYLEPSFAQGSISGGGTLTGSGRVAVAQGSTARHFNGTSSDYLFAADSTSLRSPSTSITLACWVRPTSSTQTSYAHILSKQDASYESYDIFQDSTNNLKLQAGIRVGGATQWTMDTLGMSVGTWYFAVLRWTSGGNSKLELYNSDGSLYSTAQSPSTISGTMAYNTAGFYVGNDYVAVHGWVGDITSVYIHNTNLSDTDVQTLLHGTDPAGASGLWCPFQGASPEVDQSGHGNNLTVNGTTVVSGP